MKIKTKKQLLKLVPSYDRNTLLGFKNNTLYYWPNINQFCYDKGVADFGLLLTTKQAIDLYNKLNFHKDFLKKL